MGKVGPTDGAQGSPVGSATFLYAVRCFKEGDTLSHALMLAVYAANEKA